MSELSDQQFRMAFKIRPYQWRKYVNLLGRYR